MKDPIIGGVYSSGSSVVKIVYLTRTTWTTIVTFQVLKGFNPNVKNHIFEDTIDRFNEYFEFDLAETFNKLRESI